MKKLFIIAGIFCAMLFCSCRKTYICKDILGNAVMQQKATAREIKELEKKCNCTCTLK